MDFEGIPSPPSEWRSFKLGEWLRGLGLEWFSLDISLNAYAFFILVGIFLALVVANWRLKGRGAEPWIVLDVAIWAVPFGILGGRLYHVGTHYSDYFYEGADFLRIFYVWEGGLAIFGAISLGAVGAYIGARIAGLRFTAFLDALAPGLLLAQGMGRMGNYFNQELFGAPTSLPWGLKIDRPNSAIPIGIPDETLFHPTFLYEMGWNFAGAVVLILIGQRWTLQWGRLFSLYLIWYGVGRAALETIRLDAAEIILGLRVNFWGAALVIFLGILIFFRQKIRHTGAEPSPYRPGKTDFANSKLESKDETYTVEEVAAKTKAAAGRQKQAKS